MAKRLHLPPSFPPSILQAGCSTLSPPGTPSLHPPIPFIPHFLPSPFPKPTQDILLWRNSSGLRRIVQTPEKTHGTDFGEETAASETSFLLSIMISLIRKWNLTFDLIYVTLALTVYLSSNCDSIQSSVPADIKSTLLLYKTVLNVNY